MYIYILKNNIKNIKINFYKVCYIIFLLYILFTQKQKNTILKKFHTTDNLKNNSYTSEGKNCSTKNNSKENSLNKTQILLNGKKYINKCLNKNNLIYQFNKNITPVISSIIPVYNCENTINSAVLSIQHQNFTNFEIILVNDFSNDKTLNIIENLKKNDTRIKIINNKKNMGTLYSRSIGALISKGEYIFPLDNDDLFFTHDLFDSVYKIAKNYEFDIVGFRGIKICNYTDNITKMKDLYNYIYPDNLIVRQPQLGTWLITINGHYAHHDVTVWGKGIKSKIYKEATLKLGFERYSKFVSWSEDTIINFIIFNIAQSFIFLNKYGIVHLRLTQPYDVVLLGKLLCLDIIYDFSRNNTNKNYAVNAAYFIKRKYNIKKFINNTNLIYFQQILKKLIKSRYITNQNKIRIKKDFESFF